MARRPIVAILLLISLLLISISNKSVADERSIKFQTKILPGLAWKRGFDTLESSSDTKEINTKENITLEELDNISEDYENIATVYYKNGEIIFENYHYDTQRSSPLYGFSMTKTITAMMVLNLACQNSISISERLGQYSNRLKETIFSDITIENALLMSSGIIDNFDDYRHPVWRSLMKKNSTPLEYLREFEDVSNEQGTEFHYSAFDTFALGILVEDVTNKRLSEYFEETIWADIKAEYNGFWQVSKNNENMGAYGLMASARDWLRLGNFIINQISSNKCMANHFETMWSNSITDEYGYQVWLDEDQRFRMYGHGGQVLAIDPQKREMLFVYSGDSQYSGGRIFDMVWEVMDSQ